MVNKWFRFKKFTINQDSTAMKVGTDGVLLGSWAFVSGSRRILDIGTGTGLIALMMAQRCDATIDAIEIEQDAAKQAGENIEQSAWAERIRVTCTSLQEFSKTHSQYFDLIVCNPPFFKDSLKAKTPARTIARHNDQLDLAEIVSCSHKLLTAGGHLCVILPAMSELLMLSLTREFNLFPSRMLRIRPTPGKAYKRILMDFSFKEMNSEVSELTIETDSRHQYSKEYFELTRDFYL